MSEQNHKVGLPTAVFRLTEIDRETCYKVGSRIITKNGCRIVFERMPNPRLIDIWPDSRVTVSAEGRKHLRPTISRQTKWRIRFFLDGNDYFVMVGKRLVGSPTGGYVSRYVGQALIDDGTLVPEGDGYAKHRRDL